MNRKQKRAYRKGHDMKVKFSRQELFKPEWNGNAQLPANEQVTVTLHPMTFDDVMTVMDAMGGQSVIQEATEGGDSVQAAVAKKVDLKIFLHEVGSIVPKYAKDLTNLEGDDGALTVEDIVNFPSFMSLVFEIVMRMVTISTPSEAAEGNSEGQSA